MVGGVTIPGNWVIFLRVDENKIGLFSPLSSIFHNSFQLVDKKLVIPEGDIPGKLLLLYTAVLAPCSHEADSCMMLHATHAFHNDNKKFRIHTVIVLAVALILTLEEEVKLWVSFGTSKVFWFLVAEKAEPLSIFML